VSETLESATTKEENEPLVESWKRYFVAVELEFHLKVRVSARWYVAPFAGSSAVGAAGGTASGFGTS